jgi:pyridoxal phosphate enzyme (YggS family)
MSDIASRLEHVKQRIAQAALACGRRPEEVRLVAVSKAVPLERVLAAIEAGATDLGENYIQEAREKMEALQGQKVSWHFIGHLQSNKAKFAVTLFDLIHSVDSFKLAAELNKRAAAIHKIQPILVQVNISGEKTKSGVDTSRAMDLIRQIARLENLSVRGLMTMPPYFNAPDKVRPYFKALQTLQEAVKAEAIHGIDMSELSMGMSGDFETAIEQGATLVRVGTAIFGERQ